MAISAILLLIICGIGGTAIIATAIVIAIIASQRKN
jgi:hypothetical protein